MQRQRIAMVFVLLLGMGRVVGAQESSVNPIKRPETEVRIFYLKFVAAEEAAKVAAQILDQADDGLLKIAPEARTNALIVSATPQTLNILTKVLEQIDTAGAADKERRTVKKYRMQQDTKLAVRVLSTLLAGSDARIEESGDSLIVYGNEKTHAQVQAIIGELTSRRDANESESYYVHVVWIASGGEGAKNWNLKKIPAPLKALVELKLAPRLSLESPGMVGQVLVRTSLDGDSGHINASGSGELSDDTKFEMICDAGVLKMEGGLRLQLDLNTVISKIHQIPVVGGGGRGGRGGQFGTPNNISTTIAVKLDHPVCLGVAPTNGVNSVYLIQVSKDFE